MKNGRSPVALALLVLFLIAVPLDCLQLVCMLVGALVYAAVAVPRSFKGRRNEKSLKAKKVDEPSCIPNSMKPTAMPIKAPVFSASDFDAQIDEFVTRIAPTALCHRAVDELTSIVREKIKTLIPGADVVGFTTGNLSGGTAYGVAVPDVDIVVNANPTNLAKQLQGRLEHIPLQRKFGVSTLDSRKLQKSVIRICTSLLVSAGFKFRRSSFRSEDPKVTLLAPPSMGASMVAIPLNFSLNSRTPMYNMVLLTECGQMDPRAQSLILLVKRWAKDRGICHASKGHLPPYAWSLLAIYFLQVGVTDEDGGLPLPALDAFEVSSSFLPPKSDLESPPKKQSSAARPAAKAQEKKLTVGDLFKNFVRFYNCEFHWRNEAVCVRLGTRARPNLSLNIHVVINGDGSTATAPIIEDPFDSKTNLGACTTEISLRRLMEELGRADTLLTRDASVTQLLEP